MLYAILPIVIGASYLLRAKWRAEARAAEFKALNPGVPVKIIFSDIILLNLLASLKVLPKAWFLKITGVEKGWESEADSPLYKNNPHGVIVFASPSKLSVTIADPEYSKEITTRNKDFPKPIEIYGVLDIFGKNVVTLEKEEWRRHRKVVAPRFGEKNNALVHVQTARIAKNMFEAWERNFQVPSSSSSSSSDSKPSYLVDVSADMMKLALHVISAAGFGKYIDWDADEGYEGKKAAIPAGHRLSFVDALQTSVENINLKLVVPKWAYNLPIKKLEETQVAFEEFGAYLTDLIRAADATKEDQKDNLLSSLVEATRAGNEGQGLSESEVLGNVFIFMFAGHETTAGTLAYALALLAFYPEKQQRLHEEIDRVLGGKHPAYKQQAELTYTLAIMNEVLRVYPPVVGIPKSTNAQTQNQSLYSTVSGKLTIPPNTYISVHAMALHHNAKAWGPDPLVFRPERWLKEGAESNPHSRSGTPLPQDLNGASVDGGLVADPNTLRKPAPGSFVPFSEGARGCIGKRFAQVEFVAALAMIAQRYEWTTTPGAKIEEVLRSRSTVTLRPYEHTKLIFRRRDNLSAETLAPPVLVTAN
ncbi:hypothetical protein HK097_010371 [Rhizophlyctis rosea]|uniref:Cytochrome P450 n=1 Tax=Rhizophlyctis rosea TaxID=64517 RepID=A0AAD5S9A0_9FUNG|nr:hypothetical protein HK097_010371 [Rhizophlyctis rosea]